jgi:hypothetical protein
MKLQRTSHFECSQGVSHETDNTNQHAGRWDRSFRWYRNDPATNAASPRYRTRATTCDCAAPDRVEENSQFLEAVSWLPGESPRSASRASGRPLASGGCAAPRIAPSAIRLNEKPRARRAAAALGICGTSPDLAWELGVSRQVHTWLFSKRRQCVPTAENALTIVAFLRREKRRARERPRSA